MNGRRSEEDEGRRERAGDFEWVKDFNCIGFFLCVATEFADQIYFLFFIFII
jgi:hypothetical protein